MNEQDWVERTRRAVPVLVMVAAFLGFCAALVKWIALGEPQPALMGICGTVASGGYLWAAIGSAMRSAPDPPLPPPPAPPKTASLPQGDGET